MNFKKYFETAKELNFEDIEFKVVENKTLSIEVFHKKVEKYNVSENSTLYIRGIINGNMVSASTENFSNVTQLLKEMASDSLLIEDKVAQEIFEGSKKYSKFKTYNDALENVSPSKKIDLCLLVEEKAFNYDNRIKEVSGVHYSEAVKSEKIINSKGLKLSYKTNYAYIYLDVVAKENEDTRTGGMYQLFNNLDDVNIDNIVNKACSDAINSLNGTPCDSKKYKVLFAPDVFASLLNKCLISISGDNVNKNKSLLKDKLNQVIASKKLTVVEDPHCKQYPYFYRSFDDEGVATSKKVIIDKGVLKTFLYNIEAAKSANTASTGNGYGGSQIGVDTSFVYVKPSKKTVDDLLKSINNGIQITDVAGLHSGLNTISGDFSLQASGFRIENGKITTPVNLITIAGNLFDLLKNVVDVGNDSFLALNGTLTPSVVVKNVAVSGK